MRILYGIQGTGNGHLSRAREIIPYVQDYAEVDILISGTQSEIHLDHPVAFHFRGLGYSFGHDGKIAVAKTISQAKLGQLITDIRCLPVSKYDLVISDFEPISAWAGKLAGKHVVALSHQASFLSEKSPRPGKKNVFAEGIFRHYAPCDTAIGFHFRRYDHFIHKPIIRKAIREISPTKNDHITVYLPAYHHDALTQLLQQLPEIQWHVFSKHARATIERGNVLVRPIDDIAFTRSMETCQGVLAGAGFELPSEALFLGKMLMVVPMSMQYEQQCNAKALRLMGVPALSAMNQQSVAVLRRWLTDQAYVQVRYENRTRHIIESMLRLQIAA